MDHFWHFYAFSKDHSRKDSLSKSNSNASYQNRQTLFILFCVIFYGKFFVFIQKKTKILVNLKSKNSKISTLNYELLATSPYSNVDYAYAVPLNHIRLTQRMYWNDVSCLADLTLAKSATKSHALRLSNSAKFILNRRINIEKPHSKD